MFTHKKTILQKNTIQYLVTIPTQEIQKTYDETLTAAVQEVEVPGFRKGKAPFDMAKKEIKKEAVYERTMQKMIPEIYQELVKTERLAPIISPKVELLKAQENKDWEIRVTIAEKPTIELGDYKGYIKQALLERKKEDIWVPGKSPEDAKKTDEKEEKDQSKKMQTIFDALLKQTKIEISDLLIESELEKRLTQLVDDVRKIGLTVEAYLKSKQETVETIKAKYAKEIESMYKLDFILSEIAEKDHIIVEDKDLETIFAAIKDEKERAGARANSYFYATLLRRQKTIDYLMSL